VSVGHWLLDVQPWKQVTSPANATHRSSAPPHWTSAVHGSQMPSPPPPELPEAVTVADHALPDGANVVWSQAPSRSSLSVAAMTYHTSWEPLDPATGFGMRPTHWPSFIDPDSSSIVSWTIRVMSGGLEGGSNE
jgi:hypothetical protein